MATITGWFPKEILDLSNLGRERYNPENGEWHYVDKGLGGIHSDVHHALLRQDPYTNGGGSSKLIGSWDIRVSGTPTPTESPRYVYGPKIRERVENFEQRKRAGEMIVTNYENSQAYLTFSNGGVFTPTNRSNWAKDIHFILRNYYGHSVSGGWIYPKNDPHERVNMGIPVIIAEHGSLSDDKTPSAVGFNDGFVTQLIHTLMQPSEEVLSSLWTTVLCDANASTLDILTATAEMPETVRSIINLVKSIFEAFKSAKNKELRLLNRTKRVRIEAEKRILRNNYDSDLEYQAAKNARKRRLIEKKRKALNKQIINDMKLQLEELASAAAQVWLTYRYSIMPNVYLIEDAAEVLNKHARKYMRFTEMQMVTFSNKDIDLPPGWTIQGEISVKYRAFIKRMYDTSSNLGAYFKELSADILSTAWELVPLSFVVDWITNIGEYLRALLGKPSVDFAQVATISSQFSGSLVFKHTNGATVNATLTGYKRTVVPDPIRYAAIKFAPNMNQARWNDALALSWSIFGNKFSKSINLK